MENAGRRLSRVDMWAVISGNSFAGDLNDYDYYYYFYYDYYLFLLISNRKFYNTTVKNDNSWYTVS